MSHSHRDPDQRVTWDVFKAVGGSMSDRLLPDISLAGPVSQAVIRAASHDVDQATCHDVWAPTRRAVDEAAIWAVFQAVREEIDREPR